jgi:acetyl-CoA carboxylase carboxyltransferase component
LQREPGVERLDRGADDGVAGRGAEQVLLIADLAAERGELDGIIEPAATRIDVIKSLRALRTKRASLPPKKHGNIPL